MLKENLHVHFEWKYLFKAPWYDTFSWLLSICIVQLYKRVWIDIKYPKEVDLRTSKQIILQKECILLFQSITPLPHSVLNPSPN